MKLFKILSACTLTALTSATSNDNLTAVGFSSNDLLLLPFDTPKKGGYAFEVPTDGKQYLTKDITCVNMGGDFGSTNTGCEVIFASQINTIGINQAFCCRVATTPALDVPIIKGDVIITFPDKGARIDKIKCSMKLNDGAGACQNDVLSNFDKRETHNDAQPIERERDVDLPPMFLFPFGDATHSLGLMIPVSGVYYKNKDSFCMDLDIGSPKLDCPTFRATSLNINGFNKDYCCKVQSTPQLVYPPIDGSIIIDIPGGAIIDKVACKKKVDGKCPL